MADEKLSLSNPDEIKILAFGNSLTEGYANWGTVFRPYAIALEEKLSTLLPGLKITVDVNGQSGDRVLSSLGGVFLQRLQSSCSLRKSGPPKYDLVIALGGTNDLAYRINNPEGASEIFESLKECYDHVLKSGASLLCLTVPERAIDTRTSELAKRARDARIQLNELIAEFVKSHQATAAGTPRVFIMDLARMVPFPVDKGEDEEFDHHIWSADGLHMSPEGYDFVGEKLADFIYNIL